MKFEKEKIKHRVIEDYRPKSEAEKVITHKPIPPSRSSVLFGSHRESEKPHK